MAAIKDEIEATVECLWTNIGQEWIATLTSEKDYRELAVGKSRTRAGALHNLADAIEGTL